MALASTGFMAAPGLYGTTGQLDKLDVSDVLAAILLKDTAFLGQIAMKGTVHNIEHFWFEDSLNDAYVSISLSMDAETTNPTGNFSKLSTSASIMQVLRAGTLIRPEGMDIVYEIINMTVTCSIRAHGSVTTAVSAFSVETSTATKFLIVGMPKPDTSTYSDDVSRARTRRKNYTQVFERGIQIAETREHIELYAVSDELKLQIKNRTYEIKRELNNCVINSRPYSATGPAAATPDIETRTMTGVLEMIRNPGYANTRTNNNCADASAGALTMSRINDLVEGIYSTGGFDEQSNCVCVVGPYQARIIALLEEQRIRRSSKELVVGSYANKIMTDLGFEIPVVLDRFMPPDILLIFDKSRGRLMPLKGDSWHMEKMAKTGRTQGYQLSGQYTIELQNPDEAHGMLYRLAFA
jgi:hypothetical protein